MLTRTDYRSNKELTVNLVDASLRREGFLLRRVCKRPQNKQEAQRLMVRLLLGRF